MCLSINALLLIREVNSLTARLDSIEQQNKDLMNITHKLMHITESLKTEITQCKERVKEPELTTSMYATTDIAW
jgi:predicted  nucleic acid-binding Zn-ribbon protein